MRAGLDPLGAQLLRLGLMTDEQLDDVLHGQREPMPFASICYLYGYVSEEDLVRVLARKLGMPGVVLERSIIALQSLREIPREFALRYRVLPIYEDKHRLFVALSDQREPGVVNELQFSRGKTVIPHVALQVTLARALRDGYRLLDKGDAYWFGSQTSLEDLNDPRGVFTPVLDVDDLPAGEVEFAPLDVTDPHMPVPIDASDVVSVRSLPRAFPGAPADDAADEELDLDGPARRTASRRILVADADESVRHLVHKVLGAEGHETREAGSGLETLRLLREQVPDLLILEMMLPDVAGYQICRTLKGSLRYAGVPVVLVVGGDTDTRKDRDLRERFGADALLRKPLSHTDLTATVATLLAGWRPAEPRALEVPGAFDDAIAAYREGSIDRAVELLRMAIEYDPLAPRPHFVLANVLQAAGRDYEAIEAFEHTLIYQPGYFPALSRLAFLYYKQGFLARAIETWRRCLEVCPDEAQAARIRQFLAQREAELQSHNRE
jgi:CheY-like chemotaxis protein